MEEKQKLYNELNLHFKKWRKINTWIDRILLSILLFLIVFIGSGLIDGLIFLEEGISGIKYHSFEQLLGINPDTVAWLTMDGTHIDHPVVRSADNFDYLDLSFEGKYYAGGTLFMDKDNEGPEDKYVMIHGHHMAGGAMFGDLELYLDEEFFEDNHTGTLLTPKYDYDIEVFAVGIYDAYNRKIYTVGDSFDPDYIKDGVLLQRNTGKHKHVLALSTCHDDMTDDRVVVFCDLKNRRIHR